ncbi:MAG TPA: hypothetical protein VEQ58_18455 [Polyangiaceae bacterium]|nr:hypothetical protein [Polyangiaceae bacterium]
MKRSISLLVPVVAFAVSALWSGAARADYLCSVDFSPLDTIGKGSSGYIQFSTYTGQDCTGTYTGTYNVCTTGATSTGCIANSSFYYTSAELLAELASLREAMIWNVRASVAGNGCNGGGGFCVGYVSLSSN